MRSVVHMTLYSEYHLIGWVVILYNSPPFAGSHDIQNIMVYSPNSSQIHVSGTLVKGATAIGMVLIVYTLDLVNQNVYYFEVLKKSTLVPNNNNITTTVMGLSAGQYGVSVFILEDGGLPFNRSASVPKSVFVQNGKGQI